MQRGRGVRSHTDMQPLLLASLLVITPVCLTSDQFARPVVSTAELRIDPALPDALAEVNVTLSLVGGDSDHVAYLERVFIGEWTDQSPTSIDLRLPTPTVAMEAYTVASQPLVAGDLRNRDFIEYCDSSVPLTVMLGFADTADLIAISPPARLVVFCSG